MATEKKPGFFARVKGYLVDFKGEAKKIVWPSKKQLINNTLVVLAFCLCSGAFIWILDALFNLGIKLLYTAK